MADSGRQRLVPARHERGQTPLELGSLDEDVPTACPAADPDVGTEPFDEPLVAAAGMLPPEPEDVAEEQWDDGSGGHSAGQRIRGRAVQSRGFPWLGRSDLLVAARSMRVTGVTVTVASG